MANLGHVDFYVRDLDISTASYRDVVGLKLVGRIINGRASMLTGGSTHHENFARSRIGRASVRPVGVRAMDGAHQPVAHRSRRHPGPLQGKHIGLYHVGWKVGETLDDLRRAHERIQANGYDIEGMSDYTVSQGLYLRDPDGNEIELFTDDPGVDWRRSREWMEAPVKPLTL